MSAVGEGPRWDRNSREIQNAAAAWIELRESGEWNAEKQEALEVWLAESPAHRVAYLRASDIWKRANRLRALSHSTSEAVFPNRPVLPIILRLAAVVTVVVALGAGALQFISRSGERTYSTAIGEHKTISFTDGTRIELNTNSVVRTRMTTASRTVWLDKGEAYFQVKHDPAHPFTVMIGGRRITDLGTRFLVRRGSGETEVAVLQGSVRFDASDIRSAARSAMLLQGDVALASTDTMSITKEPLTELARTLSWRHGVVVFNNTTLADAAIEFNRYNVKKIVIADPAAARFAIDGTFPTNDVEAFIDAAQRVFKLHVENHGDEFLISR
jgi:transmembrane sensor